MGLGVSNYGYVNKDMGETYKIKDDGLRIWDKGY